MTEEIVNGNIEIHSVAINSLTTKTLVFNEDSAQQFHFKLMVVEYGSAKFTVCHIGRKEAFNWLETNAPKKYLELSERIKKKQDCDDSHLYFIKTLGIQDGITKTLIYNKSRKYFYFRNTEIDLTKNPPHIKRFDYIINGKKAIDWVATNCPDLMQLIVNFIDLA